MAPPGTQPVRVPAILTDENGVADTWKFVDAVRPVRKIFGGVSLSTAIPVPTSPTESDKLTRPVRVPVAPMPPRYVA